MAKLEKEIVDDVTALTKEAAANWLRDLIRAKLEAQGVTDRPAFVEALVGHALTSGSTDSFQFSDPDFPDEELDVSIEFTDEDLAELDAMIERVRTAFPGIISDVAKETSQAIFKDLKRKWPAVRASLIAIDAGFCQRLEARWGRAFDLLRMMHYASTEMGTEAVKRLRRIKSAENRVLRGTLIRLHGRAMQTTAEIISLMENGYADGAMARWRTLHEITIVASIIQEGGHDTARRYLDHETYDSLQAANLHDRTRVPLGDKPFNKKGRATLEKRMGQLVAAYGKDFKQEYGWAAAHLKHPKKNITFADLEEALDRAWTRSPFKLASYNVHAGSKGIFFKLGRLDGSGFLAGRSNAGFEEPGINTAYTLTVITMAIAPSGKGLAQLTAGSAYVKLRDAATRAFTRTATKLHREHAEVQEAERAERAARADRKSKRRSPPDERG